MATEKEYLILSKLAYIDFNDSGKNPDIGKKVNEIDYSYTNRPEIASWKSLIDEMGNWQLINYENDNSVSGYCGAAFKNAIIGEIIVTSNGTYIGNHWNDTQRSCK